MTPPPTAGKPRVLVASDAPADAELVERMLGGQFGHVAVSADPERAVADFEAAAPAVVVLAFRAIAAAQRYTLGLYRHCLAARTAPHAAILMCSRDELREAAELCRSGHFDDYVLFWPLNHDPYRLPVAVDRALRRAEAQAEDAVDAAQLASQAQRVAELESLLARGLARGGERLDGARQAVDGAGQRIAAALDELVRAVPEAGAQAPDGLLLQRKDQEIRQALDRIARSVAPLDAWMKGLRTDVAPHLDTLRGLKTLADRVKPVVLAVDDDPLQRRILEAALRPAGVEVLTAGSAAEALRAVAARRPALILMDIELPEISGIELTRHVKALPQCRDTRVVMISGHRDRDSVVESLKAGACDFVVKPFERASLLERVARWVAAAPAAA